MDKISGIVKASPRVMAVDMKEASPVRPGTPGFGRPEGVSSLKEPPNLGGTAAKSAGVQLEVMDWKSKDSQQAALAAELSDKFFIRGRQEPSAQSGPRPEVGAPQMSAMSFRDVASKPSGFKGDDLISGAPRMMASQASVFEEEEEGPMMKQPDGLFPKGSFIDRTA